jgi:hypothetical protein
MSFHFNDKGKFFTEIVTKKPIQAKIQTITHRIEGTTYACQGERLIDELMNENQFLAVTDAVIYDKNDNPLYTCEFLSLNKAHIVWIIPAEETNPSQPRIQGV